MVQNKFLLYEFKTQVMKCFILGMSLMILGFSCDISMSYS